MISNNSRLLIVFHDLALGGIQKKVVDITRYLQKKYPQIKIQICLRKKDGLFIDQIPSNIDISAPKYKHRHFGKARFTLWILKEIFLFNPTHILSFMDFSAIHTLLSLKILFWLKPKVVIGEDILTSKYLTDVYSHKEANFKKILIKTFYPQANKILVQTPIQKKDLEKILLLPNSSKIIASPNWLPLDYPPQNNVQIQRDIDVLFIGRLVDQKNLPKFVEIINRLKLTNKNIKAVIVGSGPKEQDIRFQIRKLKLNNNIKIISQTNTPQDYYLRSKIFLLTSDYEGFPLTLMEAISCGCYPVINNLKEIKVFFDKEPNKYIFNNSNQAIKIIKKAFSNYQPVSLQYYQQKLVSLQSRDITKYINHLIK